MQQFLPRLCFSVPLTPPFSSPSAFLGSPAPAEVKIPIPNLRRPQSCSAPTLKRTRLQEEEKRGENMSKSTFEFDFFHMEKQNASSSKQPPPSPDRANVPYRGIQGLVSRINPQLLKTVMASGAAMGGRQLLPSYPPSPTAAGETSQAPLAPPLNPVASRAAAFQCPTGTAPLTIFYNGRVAAFDVPPDQAEVIIRMAEGGITGNPVQSPEDSSLVDGGQVDGDLPIARRKSLQRFLEKRKQRMASSSPYHEGTSHPC